MDITTFMYNKQKTIARKSVSLRKIKKRWGKGSSRAMERVRSLELTVHHSTNPERTIPAESRVHHVPVDDFLLFVFVPEVELEQGAELEAWPCKNHLQDSNGVGSSLSPRTAEGNPYRDNVLAWILEGSGFKIRTEVMGLRSTTYPKRRLEFHIPFLKLFNSRVSMMPPAGSNASVVSLLMSRP